MLSTWQRATLIFPSVPLPTDHQILSVRVGVQLLLRKGQNLFGKQCELPALGKPWGKVGIWLPVHDCSQVADSVAVAWKNEALFCHSLCYLIVPMLEIFSSVVSSCKLDDIPVL